MNTWKIILATLVIFGAGLVTGRLLAHRSQESQLPQAAGPGSIAHPSMRTDSAPNGQRDPKIPAPLPGLLRKDFMDRLDKELTLTASQRTRIEKIIGHGQEQTRAIWREVEPEMHKTLVSTKEKIRAELTPEQQAQFNHLLKQKPRFPGRPPGEDKPTNTPAQNPGDSAELEDWSFCSFFEIKSVCQGTNAAPAQCL